MYSKLTPILDSITAQFGRLDLPDFSAAELRVLCVLVAFWTLFALEARLALRKNAPRENRQSYFTNLGTAILNDTVMSLLSVSSLWLLAERCSESGLLSGIADPAVKALISFLLLDLVLYLWHRANHRYEALWMFHKVHHSDRCMNVSTAFRLHGIEVFLTTLIKAAFIVLTGVDTAVLLASEAVSTLFVMFHHANLGFRGERWLAWLIVVPQIHRTHHSTRRSEHDNNYGAVFSIWDRLFGTYTEVDPKKLGLAQVPGFDLWELIRFGLPGWRRPQAVRPPDAVQAMIAEAAYYRAEKRGFAPGDDFLDWFEAEREIRERIVGPRRSRPKQIWRWNFPNPFAHLSDHGKMPTASN